MPLNCKQCNFRFISLIVSDLFTGDDLFHERKQVPEYDPNEELPIIKAGVSEVVDGLNSPVIVVEIGAGTSPKSELILDIILAKSKHDILYIPVDPSPGNHTTLTENNNNQTPLSSRRTDKTGAIQ